MTPTQTSPTFSTAASTGQTLGTESFRGKVPVVLLFLPDPGASMDVLETYNAAHSDMAQRRTQLLAVAPLTASEARDLAEQVGITYPVLSDPAFTMFRDFDATTGDGDPRPCSVVVDKTGTVAAVTETVLSPEEMMAQLDNLEESSRFEMAVNR